MEEKTKAKIRKTNMKLFPITKALGWDYIFFYTTNFLFLTQIKNISAANVVLIDSFYALFGILMQVPATFIIEYFGTKKSIVIANILNCLYITMVITSINLFNLIIAELLSSLAFAIKESAEPVLLNESIPATKYKSQIFARINEKGMANWHVINAIATILAGFFYEINPYIPISLALIITVIVTIISTGFYETKTNNEKKYGEYNQLKDIKESFKFILKSERLKSLILYSALTTGLVSVLVNYQVSMLEELNISSKYLCTIFAIIGIGAGLISKKQEKLHNRFRNKTLTVLMLSVGIALTGAGCIGIIAEKCGINLIYLMIIVVFYLLGTTAKAIFHPLIERYLRNFANSEIDTKIFIAKNLLESIFSMIIGLLAAFLLERMNTTYCMSIIGIGTILITGIMAAYMKPRVGLRPEQYSEEETKYDELKVISK